MPYGYDDPWLEQARAAQSMPQMQQAAGYPYQPYTQVAPGFGGYGGGHVAADLIGGVMNAWIGRQVHKQQETQQRAQSVFNLTKLGYDLGDLLEDSQNRQAVEKTLNIKLPKNLETGGFGPRKSSAQMEEESKRDFLRQNAGNAPDIMSQVQGQATAQPGALPQSPMSPMMLNPTDQTAQRFIPPSQPVTEAQFYGSQLSSPVSADIYQQQPTPAAPAMQPQAPAAAQPTVGTPEWAKAIGLSPQMAKVVLANPELAAKLGATSMTVAGGLEEAKARAGATMAVARLEQSVKGMEFLANMRMKGVSELGLPKDIADEFAVSLVDPSVKLSDTAQNAIDKTLSTQQRQTQGQMIDWMKEAWPDMAPDRAATIATAAAKGFKIDPAWYPGGENQLARLKAAELANKEIQAQKGTWDVNTKVELNMDGKKVTLPVYLAEKSADLAKTMAAYQKLREDIPNIDAIAQMLKSETVVSNTAKAAIAQQVMERMGLKVSEKQTLSKYLRDYLGFDIGTPQLTAEQAPKTSPEKAKSIIDQAVQPTPLPAH